jgi:hypothetical protein
LKIDLGWKGGRTSTSLERSAGPGNILSGDAMLCQRDVCAAIIAAGGDYVFTVKDNQPSLVIDIGAGLAYQEQARQLADAFSP